MSQSTTWINMGFSLIGESWFWTTALLIILSFFYYWYLMLPYSYWTKRGIPSIPAKPFLGSASIFTKKQTHEIEVERYKKYGHIYGSYEGSTPVLSIADPDLLRNILVKDFAVFPGRRVLISGDPIADKMLSTVTGETWKRIRCIISPTFATGKIKKMTDIIVSSAGTLVRNFMKKEGEAIDAKEFFGTFVMDVIASVAFGIKIHSHEDPNNRFVQYAKKAFSGTIIWKILLSMVFPKLAKLFRVPVFDRDVTNFFTEATMEIIKHRKETGQVRNDFLQLLIDATNETPEKDNENIPEDADKIEKSVDDFNAEQFGHEENTAKIFKIPAQTKYLSHEELIAQCVIFLLGGFETAATTLVFASYLLAIHPDAQQRLREEVDSVILRHDGKLTYAAVQEMKYLDMVLTETLRMYAPPVRVERVAGEDYKLGDTGIVIEKGMVVTAPIYAIHHDPAYYPDPEKFKPERFTKEEVSKRHPYCYLTFGAGPRNCIAMRFALMEIKLCLAYMISQLIIKPTPETKVPLDIKSNLFLLQPQKALLCFEKRENKVFDGVHETEETDN